MSYRYTVAMTFRICFTFGLLTTIYNFYFPTILIVLLAVFNDGAMIALSKVRSLLQLDTCAVRTGHDAFSSAAAWTAREPMQVAVQDKVVASNLPNSWNLKNIFIAGIVYGLYLTLSSWVLFYVATHTSFFKDKIHMHDLRFAPRSYLEEFCLNTEIPRGAPVSLCSMKSSVPAGHNASHLANAGLTLCCAGAGPREPYCRRLCCTRAWIRKVLRRCRHHDCIGAVRRGAVLRARWHDSHAALLPGAAPSVVVSSSVGTTASDI